MIYTTRTEAINREIVEVIETTGVVEDAHAEYDVDAIADEIIVSNERGYKIDEDVDFWATVERHAN